MGQWYSGFRILLLRHQYLSCAHHPRSAVRPISLTIVYFAQIGKSIGALLIDNVDERFQILGLISANHVGR